MNVLIGGTGFLGGAVAEEIVKRQGHRDFSL